MTKSANVSMATAVSVSRLRWALGRPPFQGLLNRETSTWHGHEGGDQFKYFCPDDGLVLIDGVRGPDGQEVAQLISLREVDCDELLMWHQAVIELEAKGPTTEPG